MPEPVQPCPPSRPPSTPSSSSAPGELVHNPAKPVSAPGPTQIVLRVEAVGHLLLGHEAAPRIHEPPAQGRGHRAASTRQSWRRSRATSRASCPPCPATRWSPGSSRWAMPWTPTGSASGSWSRPTTATCRRRAVERGVRLQLRGRAPGVRDPRRAGDHRARHRRALPDPRRRGRRAAPPSRCSSRGRASRPRTRARSVGRSWPPGGRSWWSSIRARPCDGLERRSGRGPGLPRRPSLGRRGQVAAVGALGRPAWPRPGRRGCDELPAARSTTSSTSAPTRTGSRPSGDRSPRVVSWTSSSAGRRIGRPVAVDVGRVHYDLTRWVGTTGDSRRGRLRLAPADGELRAGDRVAVIGAAGPMGFMHVDPHRHPRVWPAWR